MPPCNTFADVTGAHCGRERGFLTSVLTEARETARLSSSLQVFDKSCVLKLPRSFDTCRIRPYAEQITLGMQKYD